MTKIARCIVFAKDMTTMAKFYREVVGLTSATSSDPAWQEFECDGASFALHGIPADVAESIVVETPPKPREETPIKVCFQSENVEHKRAALKSAGVEVGALHQFDGLMFFDVIDPEGNIVQFTNR